MEFTMSMFATSADYWQARAELAETTVQETANALGCSNDNEDILKTIDCLCRDIEEDFYQGWIAAGKDGETGRKRAAEYAERLKVIASA